MSSIDFLVIQVMADRINVSQPPACSVSPYSISNFLHAFQERMNERNRENEFVVDGYAVIQQSLRSHDGMLTGAGVEPTTKASVNKHAINHQAPAKLVADVGFTMIVDVEFTGWSDPDTDRLKDDARKILYNMKFLGGIITRAFFDGPIQNEAGLKGVLEEKGCMEGLIYKPNDERLQQLLRGGCSPGEALIRATQAVMDRKTDKLLNRRGLNFATMIGYQLLEDPAERKGTRDSSRRHAFAEPVFSVVDRIPAGRYIKSPKSLHDLEIVFKKQFDSASNTIFVSN